MELRECSHDDLINELVKRIKRRCISSLPRLDDEPFGEYMDTIYEEVMYRTTEQVQGFIKRKFGKDKIKCVEIELVEGKNERKGW